METLSPGTDGTSAAEAATASGFAEPIVGLSERDAKVTPTSSGHSWRSIVVPVTSAVFDVDDSRIGGGPFGAVPQL